MFSPKRSLLTFSFRRNISFSFFDWLFLSFCCYFYRHWTSLTLFVLFLFIITCRRLSFLTLLNSLPLTIDSFRISPQSKLEPIEDKQHCEDKLDETEPEPHSCNSKGCIIFCLVVLHINLIEPTNEDAQNNGESTGYLETVIHVAFSYVLFLL